MMPSWLEGAFFNMPHDLFSSFVGVSNNWQVLKGGKVGMQPTLSHKDRWHANGMATALGQ
jgi:hypothetical protein